MIQKLQPEATGSSVPLSEAVRGFDAAYASAAAAQSERRTGEVVTVAAKNA